MRFYIFFDELTGELFHIPWDGKGDPIIVECTKRPKEFEGNVEEKEDEPIKH